ncbi:MAG TPA: DNA polymerase III subunit gamma/tau [Candidatus Pacebacteria bacterium]|nr:DNA polymerase III subunit gamma/tau [Candidatus Paceibacterota bacterium]
MNNIESNTLYRKYRPSNFEEILGQEEIVEILKKSIENKNFSHSYIFSGDRGTGKTSMARIFAREVGCSQDDIYEMDGASNRGINEIREIRDAVGILPISSEYKVYIIDEVHMLTKDAFNALLKTLEEPPKHVIFILATTELEKILPTIISRCQVFDFKNPSMEILSKMVKNVSEKEGREIDNDSSLEIAKKGKGSFRDTLSVLQKVLSILDKKIILDEVKNIFGESFGNLENDFLEALSEKNKEKTFKTFFELKKNNFDTNTFINNIIEKVRISLLIKNSSYFSEMEKDGDRDFLEKLDLNSLILKKFLEVEEKIQSSVRKDLAFEIFLIEFFE